MRVSSAVPASLLLVLIGGCFVVEAARHRFAVRKNRTTYRIDWWDDGRVEPYRVIYRKRRLKSIYTFEELGRLKTLTVGTTKYTFSYDIEAANGTPEVQASTTESRMLFTSDEDEAVEEVHSGHRRLYDCADCEETWDTLCGVGIVDVCSWVPFLPSVFNEDAQSSLTIMCTGLGTACEMSAFDACEGKCLAGELHVTWRLPRDVKNMLQVRRSTICVGFFTTVDLLE